MNFIILPSSLVLNNGKGSSVTIKKEDARFEKIIELLKSGATDEEIEKLINIEEQLEKEGFTVEHGLVQIDGKPVPEVIGQRILEFYKLNLPYKHLVKFVRKLRNNPSFNSIQMLYKFLEHNGHPITTEGNFIAYKAVRPNFLDIHTGKFDNSVGNIVSMERSSVDDNPENTCSSGLHVATLGYAQSFGGYDSILIDVEIDPADVVSVPKDYDGTKMRTCKYKVVAVNTAKRIIESPLVDSSYAEGYDIPDDKECPNCGADVDEFDSFCKDCGEEL